MYDNIYFSHVDWLLLLTLTSYGYQTFSCFYIILHTAMNCSLVTFLPLLTTNVVHINLKIMPKAPVTVTSFHHYSPLFMEVSGVLELLKHR